MDGGDDACGDGARQGKGVADGDHPIADPRFGAVAELDERQRLLRLDLQHRYIGRRVTADQLGRIFLAIGKGHRDGIDRSALGTRGHDMIVGDDIAVSRDDEPRAERLGLPRLRLGARALAEQVAKRRAREWILNLHTLLGGNIDHRGLKLFHHVGEAGRGTGGRCGLHPFVLRDLRADVRAGCYGDGGATEKQGTGKGISVTHS